MPVRPVGGLLGLQLGATGSLGLQLGAGGGDAGPTDPAGAVVESEPGRDCVVLGHDEAGEGGLFGVLSGAVVHGMRMTEGCDRDTGGPGSFRHGHAMDGGGER